MRCRADRLILRPRCPGQRDAGLGTTPGAEGDGGAKAGVALSGLRRPGPQSPRSVEFRAEIGSVPHRDRFDGGAPGGRGREVGISVRVRRRRRRTRTEMSTSTGTRPCAGGSRSPRAPGHAAPGPTSTAGSYPTPHGRTQIHEVVPGLARSYLKAPLQYDPAPQRTTARIHVRPREPGYDRPEVTAAGPVGRTTTRATAPPHDPPTAPDPSPPHPDHGHPPRPQAAQHVRPPTTTGPVTNRLTAQPRQTNRTRAGTEPNSTARTENRRRPAVLRAEGDGPPSHEHARLPHDRDHHQDRRPVSVIYPDWRPRRSSPRPRGRGNDRPSRRA